MSSGPAPAASMAACPAAADMVAVLSTGEWGAGPQLTTRRSLMPVRSVIHWSLVSKTFSRSTLLTTTSGTAQPIPVMALPLIVTGHPFLYAAAPRSCGAQPGDGLAHLDPLPLDG